MTMNSDDGEIVIGHYIQHVVDTGSRMRYCDRQTRANVEGARMDVKHESCREESGRWTFFLQLFEIHSISVCDDEIRDDIFVQMSHQWGFLLDSRIVVEKVHQIIEKRRKQGDERVVIIVTSIDSIEDLIDLFNGR